MTHEGWALMHGDAPGEHRRMEIAAAIATFVPADQIAVRVETSTELRTDTNRLNYFLNPHCLVHGQPVTAASLRDGLLHGTLAEDHPAMLAMLALANAQALRTWIMRGLHHRLDHSPCHTRCRYVPGSSPLIPDVRTIGTRSFAKASALGLLGMPLYNVKSDGTDRLYIVHRYSREMLNAQGEPVTYDAKTLIEDERDDRMSQDHPFAIAFMARKNYEAIWRTVESETRALIVTPDVVRKGALYDPEGLHNLMHPNASGKQWDAMETAFFG